MSFELEPCIKHMRQPAALIFLAALFAFPLTGTGATVALTKDGPETAREGDLIEYRLEVVNEGTADVAGVEVLDTLPAEVTFVQATPTPGGSYNPASGVWTLPTLGTAVADKTAGLRLEVMVNQNLISGPTVVVSATNRAEVVAPAAQLPLDAQTTTNIICAFCIDWEIVSVTLDSAYTSFPDPFQLRFFLYVDVANNGPVTSDATVSATHFAISAFGAVPLSPNLPVAVSLDPGRTRTLTFATDWLEAPESTYTIDWEFQVSDVALLDPVLPNTAAGTWTGIVEGGGGGGCFIATAAYGSYLDPHVRSLRRFRDETLMRSRPGRILVSLYYDFSPPIAAYIEHKEGLKTITRMALTPVVFAVESPVLALLAFCTAIFMAPGVRKRISKGR
ncbi:MAG: DUF11 domain-containing protein [Gammaproteobacteria bacterium]